MKQLFFSFFCICLLGACSKQPTEQEIENKTHFFDLSEYFNQEIAALETVAEIQKNASINGLEEKQVIQKPDFAQELQLFIASDINRASWLDKYSIDSLLAENGELQQLTYTALEDKLRTRKVVIDFNNENVSHIHIINTTDNVIAQTKQELSYIPQKGYNISSFQDVLFSEPRNMDIKVLFKTTS